MQQGLSEKAAKLERLLWRSDNGVDYAEKHCGNCYYGCLARAKRNRTKYECCGYKAAVITEVDGKVAVQSPCSGKINWVKKKAVILEKENNLL